MTTTTVREIENKLLTSCYVESVDQAGVGKPISVGFLSSSQGVGKVCEAECKEGVTRELNPHGKRWRGRGSA